MYYSAADALAVLRACDRLAHFVHPPSFALLPRELLPSEATDTPTTPQTFGLLFHSILLLPVR